MGAAGWYRSDTSSYISSYFEGEIKDIMIFDEQLDPEQVQNLSEGSRESVAPELSDADLIDTTLIKKFGFQSTEIEADHGA